MALHTVGDLQTELLVRNNRSTADSFITDAMLQDWTRQSHTWATGFKPWTFTEGRVSTTYAGSEELYFEGYKADSFRLVQIDGKRLKKLDFRNYQTFREEEPDSNERVFSDFGKLVFVNPNIDLSGTLTAWGQYQPIIDPTDTSAETVFTSFNAEANEGVLAMMTSYLKKREHEIEESIAFKQEAQNILEEVWGRTLDEQHQYQTHASSGGMFERFDVLEGEISDNLFKRDQF